MCACDTVKVNPSSLIMIHKCWCFLFGGYNADELRNMAKTNEAYDKSQISIYQRKTKLSETVLSHMMAATTYMTGKEALEKGFADELMEDAEPLDIAASADGRTLFVKGRQMHLTPGMFAPDHIPTVNPDASASDKTNKFKQQAKPAATEGGITMANSVEDLRKEFPDLTAQMEADIRASVSADNTDAVQKAIQDERDRLAGIDEVASLFEDELVKSAKYGEDACSAQELAYRAAQKAAKNGQKFMDDLKDDAKASGAKDVGAAPGEPDDPTDGADLTDEQKQANARAAVAKMLGKKED